MTYKSHPEITQEYLSEILSYDRNTGDFSRKAFMSSRAKPGDNPGTLDRSNGYIKITINYKRYYAHRLAWMIEYGHWPSGPIDHIDGDKTNNAIRNLRVVDWEGNARNQKLRSDNTSGVCGVAKTHSGKWRAYITNNKNIVSLGVFESIREAESAREKAKDRYGYHYNHGRRS